MITAIWLLVLQASLGAFDTLYYHEYRLRLADQAHSRLELRLHAARDFAYAVIVGSLGFVTWRGSFAWALVALLALEIGITLWDFIEEDKVRRLPAGERAMHAIMGIVYGAFLAFLIPQVSSGPGWRPALVPAITAFPRGSCSCWQAASLRPAFATLSRAQSRGRRERRVWFNG